VPALTNTSLNNTQDYVIHLGLVLAHFGIQQCYRYIGKKGHWWNEYYSGMGYILALILLKNITGVVSHIQYCLLLVRISYMIR